MGRLTRLLAATIAAMALALLAASTVAAFDGFGARDADSSYGREMRFDVGYSGGPPDRLELLLRTPGTDGAFVAPVDGGPTRATYVWDTAADYVTPNSGGHGAVRDAVEWLLRLQGHWDSTVAEFHG